MDYTIHLCGKNNMENRVISESGFIDETVLLTR